MTRLFVILKDAYLQCRMGRILCRWGPERRTLVLQDGWLVHATSNAFGEKLADILHRRGKISSQMAAEMNRSGRDMRAVCQNLVERGILSQSDILEALKEQAWAIAFQAMALPEAEVAFQEMKDLPLENPVIKINLALLMAQGIRRQPYNSALHSRYFTRVPLPARTGEEEVLNPEEKEIFSIVDGVSNAEALSKRWPGRPEVFWTGLSVLHVLGKVEFREEVGLPEEPEGNSFFREATDPMAEVLIMREMMETANPRQLLQVSPRATETEIKRAYFNLARKFHPDAFHTDLPSETKQLILEVFDRLTQTYQSLIEKSRTRKKEEWPAGPPPPPPMPATPLPVAPGVEAAALVEKAKKAYDEARYEDAVVLFREAVRLERNRSDYFLLLAKTESKRPGQVKKAERAYHQAQVLKPTDPEPLVGLGLLYKKEGMFNMAFRQFESALALDPEHPVARVEYELMRKSGMKKR